MMPDLLRSVLAMSGVLVAAFCCGWLAGHLPHKDQFDGFMAMVLFVILYNVFRHRMETESAADDEETEGGKV